MIGFHRKCHKSAPSANCASAISSIERPRWEVCHRGDRGFIGSAKYGTRWADSSGGSNSLPTGLPGTWPTLFLKTCQGFEPQKFLPVDVAGCSPMSSHVTQKSATTKTSAIPPKTGCIVEACWKKENGNKETCHKVQNLPRFFYVPPSRRNRASNCHPPGPWRLSLKGKSTGGHK